MLLGIFAYGRMEKMRLSFRRAMKTKSLKNLVQDSLERAGVIINGQNPWDIRVNDERFYARVAKDRSIGLGESYVEGWINIEAIDEMIYRLCLSEIVKNPTISLIEIWTFLKSVVINPQSYLRSFEVGEKHYDLGNDLFQVMLDPKMVYSCAYWKDAATLEEAQTAKLDLICRKLELKPGQTLLDIGSGWGGLAAYAAKNYGVNVVGITVSKEQLAWAENVCKGLPVEFRLEDYRKTRGKFDRVVSVGQFEHVGYKNYATYMQKVRDLLKDDGLFLLHTIGNNRTSYYGEPWLEKYIFPNSMTPSIAQLGKSFETTFIMEDWHNFGADYAKTLMAWYHNFESNWPKIASKYGERFFRMWRYYLLCSAGAFRSRTSQLWQIVLSKEGVPNGYKSLR